MSSNGDSNKHQERLNMLILEEKLLKLQKVHNDTCKEFKDLKIKYQSCLQEIQDLEKQISEAKLIHDDKLTMPITLITPTLPCSSTNSLFNNSGKSHSSSSHCKTKSLSTELKSNKRCDLVHLSIIQKLQDDIKQLSLLHEDKTKGLDAIKSEF